MNALADLPRTFLRETLMFPPRVAVHPTRANKEKDAALRRVKDVAGQGHDEVRILVSPLEFFQRCLLRGSSSHDDCTLLLACRAMTRTLSARFVLVPMCAEGFNIHSDSSRS